MIRFAVGLKFETGKAVEGDLLALFGIQPFQSCKFGSRAVAH
jgi:hypothetical protein